MEINYALIGKRIRETRKQRGLSAEEWRKTIHS